MTFRLDILTIFGSNHLDFISQIPGIKELPGLDGEDLKLPDAPPEADTLLEQLLSPRRKRTLVSEMCVFFITFK